jgi:hypothetical protein
MALAQLDATPPASARKGRSGYGKVVISAASCITRAKKSGLEFGPTWEGRPTEGAAFEYQPAYPGAPGYAVACERLTSR